MFLLSKIVIFLTNVFHDFLRFLRMFAFLEISWKNEKIIMFFKKIIMFYIIYISDTKNNYYKKISSM